MSSEWPLVPLESIALDVTVGFVGTMADQYVDAGIPFLRSLNIKPFEVELSDLKFISPEFHQKIKKSALQPGDVAIVRTGKPGTCTVIPDSLKDANCSDLVLVRCGPLLRPKFLSYWVNAAAAHHISSHLVGAVQQHFNVGAAKKMLVACPPLSVQDEVIEVVGGINDRITLLRETNATLEAIAQALFKSWFVDFDPVRAKMEGRAPEGMDEATAALFPDSFEETELEAVPRGWKLGTLGDVAQTARSQVQPDAMHSSLHYVGLEHIPRKCLSLSDWGVAEGLESAKSCFVAGDILFGKLRPYFHKVVVAPMDGVCSTDILVCRPTKPEYYGFVVMQLFGEALVTYAERLSNGAKMPRVNWKDLAAYELVVPAQDVAEAFTAAVQPLLNRMAANVFEAKTLATLRDTLLPRLISGQLRLPEAQAELEAVDAV